MRGTPLAQFLKEEAAWTRLMARRAEGEKGARVRGMTARLGRAGGNWVCVVAASNYPSAAAFALERSDWRLEIRVKEEWMEVVVVIIAVLRRLGIWKEGRGHCSCPLPRW